MFKSITFFIRYYLAWMVFFLFNRVVFEAWNYKKFAHSSFLEIAKTFSYGFLMDTSMAAYFCAIPFLIVLFCWFFPKIKIPVNFIRIYTLIIMGLVTLITCIDFNIYTEWNTKINGKAVTTFINSPNEAMASTASSPITLSLLIGALIFTCGLVVFQLGVFKKTVFKPAYNAFVKLFASVLLLGLTFLSVRGGTGVAPMNVSRAYFSNEPILNHSAINTTWLLIAECLKRSDNSMHYVYFSDAEANKVVADLYKKDAPSKKTEVLNTPKPNVVFIILESFTADVIAELGGEQNVTPAFSGLIKQGLLFSNVYASGDRTDKGLVAVLSAFPSQAIRSIILENGHQEKLPSVMNELSLQGYQNSFFYGGDSNYSNFKSYLLSHEVSHLVDAKNFKSEELTSKWGAYDELTLGKQLDYLKTAKQPFFSVLLTLSNHEPFKLPTQGKFGEQTIEDKFRSTAYYTAECLKNYFEAAKKESWYQNTLFVLVADHGHRLPKNKYEIYESARFHIPLLMLGGALKDEWKGKTIDKFGSQTDIVPTVLKQLNYATDKFKYGNNLLDDRKDGFGFYCWDNGFGIIDRNKAISFDPIGEKIIFQQPKSMPSEETATALKDAKAMMQSVFKDYRSY